MDGWMDGWMIWVEAHLVHLVPKYYQQLGLLGWDWDLDGWIGLMTSTWCLPCHPVPKYYQELGWLGWEWDIWMDWVDAHLVILFQNTIRYQKKIVSTIGMDSVDAHCSPCHPVPKYYQQLGWFRQLWKLTSEHCHPLQLLGIRLPPPPRHRGGGRLEIRWQKIRLVDKI